MCCSPAPLPFLVPYCSVDKYPVCDLQGTPWPQQLLSVPRMLHTPDPIPLHVLFVGETLNLPLRAWLLQRSCPDSSDWFRNADYPLLFSTMLFFHRTYDNQKEATIWLLICSIVSAFPGGPEALQSQACCLCCSPLYSEELAWYRKIKVVKESDLAVWYPIKPSSLERCLRHGWSWKLKRQAVLGVVWWRYTWNRFCRPLGADWNVSWMRVHVNVEQRGPTLKAKGLFLSRGTQSLIWSSPLAKPTHKFIWCISASYFLHSR